MKRKTEQLTQGQKSIRSFFFAPRSVEATKENNLELQINVESTLPAEDNVVETKCNANLQCQATALKAETAELPSLNPSPANQESQPSSPLPSPHKKAVPQQLQPPQQPQPSQSPSDGMNPYERQRIERIKRNAQVMAQLGLLQSAAALAAQCSGSSSEHPNTKKPPSQKNKKKSCKDELTHGPVRRSSRHLGTSSHPNNNNNENSDGQQNTDQHQRESSPQLVFQNSNVHTYVCQLFHHPSPIIINNDNDTSNNNSLSNDDDDYFISTFAKLPPTMYDASLSKAYALDWQPAGGLIAAGGKDGICAIFGSSAGGNDNDDELVPSLMSSKLHKGWISDVQFVSSLLSSSSSSQCAATTTTPMSGLITAGNDGVVSLWDLSQSTDNNNNNHNNNSGRTVLPQQVAESSIIHGGHGIFSLHHTGNGRIVTGSKDWSVVVSGLYQGSSSIKVVQRYDDVHEGVVKCVRWRGSNNNSSEQQEEVHCFASCGNDHKIAITDTRESTTSTKAAIAIVDSHSSAINSLRWHPSNPNLLLTASHDPHILIHDLRNTTLPLFTLTGHILPSIKRIPHIYQPTWVAGGDAVATPGASNTALVVYCAKTGEAVSQGEVVGLAGGRIGLIGCRGVKKDDPLVCVTNKHVHLLKPRFERKRRG
jgi:WD40 repeat protein